VEKFLISVVTGIVFASFAVFVPRQSWKRENVALFGYVMGVIDILVYHILTK